MPERILTLTTDFGVDGPYVASIKGMVLGLAPGTCLVDVSHAIAPQDIAEGGFVLASIVDFFPKGTVHLAVVDPGVGTDRRIIAVEVAGQRFVLPDNGLIGEVLRDREPSGIWEIRPPSVGGRRVSSTFHGRDIMAPAAAYLLNGGDPRGLGLARDDWIRIPEIPLEEEINGLVGKVVFIDSFGNLITNLFRERLGDTSLSSWEVEILGLKIDGMIRTYGECPPGSVVALIGSNERVEIAVVNGDASKVLRASKGTSVLIRQKREPLA